LLFAGVAFLVFSRYLTSWRDLRVLKMTIGAAVPLGLLILYFASKRSFGDLWFWTMSFNYGVYAPATVRTLSDAFAHMLYLLLRIFKADVVVVVVGLMGYAVFGWRQLRKRFNRRDKKADPELFRDALVIAPAVYFLFCLVNLQAGPDLIPLFPFIGMFASLFLVEMSTAVARRYQKLASVKVWAPRAALIGVLAVAVCRGGLDFIKPILTLQQQDREFEVVSSAMAPDDKLYVHGTIELLVLLNRRNLNQFIFLDRGKDEYIDAVKEGGIDAWIEEMESERPTVVALSRLNKVAHRDELMRWVETRYESLGLPGYEEICVRKP
jgi:hypothetical protein